jgi:Transposase IS116/IS110/IS902 family
MSSRALAGRLHVQAPGGIKASAVGCRGTADAGHSGRDAGMHAEQLTQAGQVQHPGHRPGRGGQQHRAARPPGLVLRTDQGAQGGAVDELQGFQIHDHAVFAAQFPAGAGQVRHPGDPFRFRTPGQLCSWAGLTPRHYESDTKVIRGHVSKQGSRMLRWALVEAIQRQPAGTKPQQVKDAIIARRGAGARNIAKTAAARVLLTHVFYSMRDGHIRRAISQAA